MPRSRGPARSKDTARAEARRRHRAALHQERLRAQEIDEDEEPDEDEITETPARPRLTIPDVRGDLAALPSFFRTKRLLWLTTALMIAGFLSGLAISTGRLAGDTTAGVVAAYLYQSTLLPPPIIPIFLAGFAVPRGSYLAGILFGFASAILYLGTLVPATTTTPINPADVAALIVISVLSGGVIGAFAAWYRDFLQRSASRRRMAQQERQKQRRRDERKTSRSARYPADPR